MGSIDIDTVECPRLAGDLITSCYAMCGVVEYSTSTDNQRDAAVPHSGNCFLLN